MTSDEFQTWRRKLNLTQVRAGELLGVSKRAVQYYESGDRPVVARVAQRYKDISLRAWLYSRTNPSGNIVETPVDFFRRLHAEFCFTLDAAALPSNAKVRRFISPERDALTQEWTGRVWLNPPYLAETIPRWVEHAHQQSLNGASVVVVLLPARTSAKWFAFCIERAAEIRFIRGRLFRNSRHSCLVVFRQHRHRSPKVTVIPARV